MSEVQTKMQAMLDKLIEDGRERGVQLAVYHKGKLVIDAFAGKTDATGKTAVAGDTLFPIFSVTKGILSTLAHLVVERKLVSYDTPVAEVWPEFAKKGNTHGKEKILFRHVLNHTAGMQFIPQNLKPLDLNNWQTMIAALADATPASPPGSEIVYHAVTFGWLVGEVVRRVDGRSIEQMIAEEICKPLGMTDMYSGMPKQFDDRVAELDEIFPPDHKFPDPADTSPKEIANYMWPLHKWMNQPAARRGCIPASNGIMTARTIARHYASLLPGGVDGVELLPPSRIKSAMQLTVPTKDPAQGEVKAIGLGYFLIGDPTVPGSLRTAFGHGGYGGSIGFADLERQLAVGFTKNLFSKAGATGDVLAEVRNVLGVPQ